MDAYKISVKFFAKDGSIHDEAFVPVFHGWIQGQLIPEHLLIDVADYAHVHNGPGVLLVSHEANFFADRDGGRLGLTYQRKQLAAGSFSDRLRQAVTAALRACALLEESPGLKFRTDEIAVRIHDRLLAPNTAETFAAVKGEIGPVMSRLFGPAAVTMEHVNDPEALFEVRVKSDSRDEIGTLIQRLTA